MQALFLGYAETVASEMVPFVVSDRVASPPELSGPPFLWERLLYHPHSHFYSGAYGHPNDSGSAGDGGADGQILLHRAPLKRRLELGLPPDAIILCSFSQMYKITPDVFAVWLSILKRTNNTVQIIGSQRVFLYRHDVCVRVCVVRRCCGSKRPPLRQSLQAPPLH